jgi:two-component system, NarL family, sensor histidine kinase LiaS
MKSRAVPLWGRMRVQLPFRGSGLRGHMTISYVVVTLGSVVSFLLLVALTTGVLAAFFPDPQGNNTFLRDTQQQAQAYALVAALQGQGTALDPRTSFVPGQAHTIALPGQENQVYNVFAPYISTATPDPTPATVAMLIAPDGRLVASSYPSYYPAGMAAAALLPEQRRAIGQALAGQASTGTEQLDSGTSGYAAEPVWSRDHQPIGAIFLQAPEPRGDSIFSRLVSALLTNSLLLVLVIPIGVFFGRVTTRRLVQRVQQLVLATTRFAGGDYTQRVVPTHQDEIGQLEQQFNQMAEQLAENIALQKQLAEQNARLEERSRISRELHDAISQDLFSLRMLADGLQEATRAGSSPSDLSPHVALLEQTTSSMTREMRALLLELRPTQLDELGLVGALQKLAQMYSTRLGITVSVDLKPVALAVKTEHALLRIAQEALANAARHSNASLVSLCLAPCEGRLGLTITDNGVGFDQQASEEQHGLGLQLMRERVQELHGTFTLETAPGQGTCISVNLPLEEVHD